MTSSSIATRTASAPDSFFTATLAEADPEIAAAIKGELGRQRHEVELIASENIVSRAVLEAQGSVMTNKYAEGYPGARYYGGCEWVDVAETLAIERAKKLFGCGFANVQPHSGAQANGAVMLALTRPGDTIMGLSLDAGGHLTHGAKAAMSGKWYNAVQYGVRRDDHLIDFDRLGLDDARLAGVLAEARLLGFAGLNVTYPFKQAVLPLLDGLADDAAAMGAVNTVVFGADGRSMGHNTDCWGFARSFREGLVGVARDRVLQLGSGGAGAAVSQALLQEGVAQLDIYDTDPARARALADRLRQLFDAEIAAVDQLQIPSRLADGIVNATPVGMAKHPGLPLDGDLILPRHWVADVVYFPLETALLSRARALGCRVLPGGGMAVYQAVRAFELFTGIKPDADAINETFQAAIGARGAGHAP